MATNMMNTNPISTAGSGARSPNATPTTTSTAACTTSVTTSRSTRPAMMASRFTGVTRNRSITPDRQSEMMAKPTKVEPNSASWISKPGTKKRYALPPPPSEAPGSPFSSGPNSARYRIGWVRPMMTQAGWRSASRSWRRKTSIVSRMKDMPTPCRPRLMRVPGPPHVPGSRLKGSKGGSRRAASARSG